MTLQTLTERGYRITAEGTCSDTDGTVIPINDEMLFDVHTDPGPEVTISSASNEWPHNVETIAKELEHIRRRMESAEFGKG